MKRFENRVALLLGAASVEFMGAVAVLLLSSGADRVTGRIIPPTVDQALRRTPTPRELAPRK